MKASHFVSSIALWAVLVSVLVGCTTPTVTPTAVTVQPTATPQPETQETPVATEPPAATEVAPPEATELPPVPSANDNLTWVADGAIADGEYTDSADFGKIRLWWRHDGEHLYFAMEGDTQGWVSVGIEPTRAMKDADYFFGFVVNGEAKLWDAFGMGTTGPTHPADEEIGGANHILEFAGVETGGLTRFELKRLLDTGDVYDKALVPGNSYNIIIAIGDDDDYDGYHSLVRSGEMMLQP
ncbi:MAG: DOMON domain protein [Chloroflexi bacterium ADurb.Bin360]|nr:MAG: DOMON domain protein [Chloroflexi bacterium ADurb.Bin360]